MDTSNQPTQSPEFDINSLLPDDLPLPHKRRTKLPIQIAGILGILLVLSVGGYYFHRSTPKKPPVIKKIIPKALPFNTKTTLLMTVPSDCSDGLSPLYTHFSLNGHHVASVCSGAQDSTHDYLLYDGVPQKVYGVINPDDFSFDPGFDQYAYFVEGGSTSKDQKQLSDNDIMVLNGKIIGSYPKIQPLDCDKGANGLDYAQSCGLLFGEHIGFTSTITVPPSNSSHGSSNDFNRFVFDGKYLSDTKTYEYGTTAAISKDGSTNAFYASRPNSKDRYENGFLVINGREEKIDAYVWNILLNSNGTSIAYVATTNQNGDMQVVFNNKTWSYYAFSPNTMVIEPDSLTMSQDGKRLAYQVVGKNGTFWNIDSKLYQEYLTPLDNKSSMPNIDASQFIFSPDGKKFALTAAGANSSHASPKQMVIENGVAGKVYENVSQLTYSKDSSTLAYIARNGTQEYIVVSNIATPIIGATQTTLADHLTISPDGKTVVYTLGQNVVINGKSSGTYDGIFPPFSFSLDGKYVGYGAQKGNQLWWVVQDLSNY